MKKSGSVPIKVALYGMDPSSYKAMKFYLKGPCRGIAEVVEEAEAEIDIIDADFPRAGDILESRRQKTPQRPIVLLSLQALKIENTYFVAKPVNAKELIATLTQLEKIKNQQAALITETLSKDELVVLEPDIKPVDQTQEPQTQPSRQKRSAFQDNEGGYTTFLGMLSDIDFNDMSQLRNASFNPKNYLLGYVLSAIKVSVHQGSAYQLNSIWKPLLIFPDTRQIWLDADDKQLRAFAGIEQNKIHTGNIGLIPIDALATAVAKDPDKFQDMDSFIWKLALWTSKGRFPSDIDPSHPVYLKHWPNFTRLLLIPDAMRMAALLVEGARSPLEMVKVLRVKPQYAFAFISACRSLGILVPAKCKTDEIVISEPPKPNKKQSLFSKILHKLRGE
jgi:hypothetical protein